MSIQELIKYVVNLGRRLLLGLNAAANIEINAQNASVLRQSFIEAYTRASHSFRAVMKALFEAYSQDPEVNAELVNIRENYFEKERELTALFERRLAPFLRDIGRYEGPLEPELDSDEEEEKRPAIDVGIGLIPQRSISAPGGPSVDVSGDDRKDEVKYEPESVVSNTRPTELRPTYLFYKDDDDSRPSVRGIETSIRQWVSVIEAPNMVLEWMKKLTINIEVADGLIVLHGEEPVYAGSDTDIASLVVKCTLGYLREYLAHIGGEPTMYNSVMRQTIIARFKKDGVATPIQYELGISPKDASSLNQHFRSGKRVDDLDIHLRGRFLTSFITCYRDDGTSTSGSFPSPLFTDYSRGVWTRFQQYTSGPYKTVVELLAKARASM